MGVRQTMLWSARGVVIGLAAAALAVGAVRLISGHSPDVLLPVVLAVAGPVLGAAAGVVRWPGRLDAARAVDSYFALQDRVTTALEFRHQDDPLSRVQRWEAGRAIATLPLSLSARERPGKREAWAGCVAAVALLGAVALPSPRQPARAARPAGVTLSPAARQAALARLADISRAFQRDLTPAQRQSPAAQRARLLLARLREEILHAPTQATALLAISQTQQQLQRVGASVRPVSPQSSGQLADQLRNSMTPSERRQSQLGPNGTQAAAAHMLQRMAAGSMRADERQRSRLANDLARASNHLSDSNLRQALRNAASALARNDRRTASKALHSAARRLRKGGGQRRTRGSIMRAREKLDGIKDGMSGLRQHPPGLSKHNPLSNQGDQNTNARRNLTGLGQQTGVGRTSSGRQAGSSPKPNQRRGDVGTNTNVGGQNRGRRNNGHGRPDHYATVYIPGSARRGPLLPANGSSANPAQVPVVSYQRVIGRYQRSARSALDRMPLPPDVRGYVQRYFARLSH